MDELEIEIEAITHGAKNNSFRSWWVFDYQCSNCGKPYSAVVPAPGQAENLYCQNGPCGAHIRIKNKTRQK